MHANYPLVLFSPIMKSASFGRSLFYFRCVPVVAAVILALGGAGLIMGWPHVLILHSLLQQPLFLPTTKTCTAIAILIAGLALGLQVYPNFFASAARNRFMRQVAHCLAAIVILLGMISFLEIAIGVETVIRVLYPAVQSDYLKIADHAMPSLTAACAIMAGWGLYRLDHPTRNMRYPSEYCALAVAVLMCIPIISYLFNVQVLAHFTSSAAISREALAAFLLLAVGMLFSRPNHPMMAVLYSPAPGGRLLRSVLPATLILLVVLALLAEWGARQGFYPEAMVTPVMLLVGGALLLMLFWRAALMLNQEYGSRVKGEAELAQTNDLIRIVSDFTTDAICVKDRKGRYIFANPMALKIFGKPTESIVGYTSGEVLNDPDVAATIEANHRAVLNEGKPSALEITLKTGIGMRTYYVTTAPWFNKQGTVMGTVGIATDITDRKQVEDGLRAQEARLEKLVEARTQEVRELIGHIETMREEEKRAIARELHDDMGASLTALNMHLAILFQQIPHDPGMAERIVQIKALLGSITATKRRIQNGLRPDKLDIFGIKTAISDQALDFENYTGVTCTVSLPDEDIQYSSQVETSMFRMVQEALNNIAKHAKASHVDIILDDDGESIYLTIRDNGVGILPETRPHSPTHGLRGMRERAAYLGGSIAVDSKPGCGTRISITLPKIPVTALANSPSAMELPDYRA